MNRLLSGWKKHRKSTYSKSFTFFSSDNKDKIYTKNRTLVDKMSLFFSITKMNMSTFQSRKIAYWKFLGKTGLQKIRQRACCHRKKMNLVHKYMSIKMVVLMACVYTCVFQIKFLVIFFCQ